MFYFAEMRSFLWKPFLCTDKEVICPLSATGSSWEDPIKVIILVLFDFVILVIIFILLSRIGGYKRLIDSSKAPPPPYLTLTTKVLPSFLVLLVH